MKWSHGVDVSIGNTGDIYNFVMLLDGVGRMTVSGREMEYIPEQNAVVMAPQRPARAVSDGPTTALFVRVDRVLAQSHLAALTGIDRLDGLDFDPDMPLVGEAASVWRFVQQVAAEIDQDMSILRNPLVRARISDAIMTGFLYAHSHNFSYLLRREIHTAEPRYVRRVEEYLEAHCDQPITARDLAEVAGVSVSAIYAGFKRHRGCAPLKFLEEIRLRRVHDALLKGLPGTTIKDVGLRWGFSNPSGLSRAYGRRFGETPSETLRRAAKRS
jgi:AraC-like DNA-binding protein